MAITPGADMALVMKNTINYKKKGGIITALGICSGLLIYGLLSASGLSMLLNTNKSLFNIIRYAGAAYLIYLGLIAFKDVWRKYHANQETENFKIVSENSEASYYKLYMEGILTNLLNPKVMVMYCSIIPQFVAANANFFEIMKLVCINLCIGLGWLYCYSSMLDYARSTINRPSVNYSLQSLTGTVMICLGLKMFFEV
jgi:threonine/homoserine/homoserine lactone efflux protein